MTTRTTKLEYQVVQGWDRLPAGWSYVEAAAVATDSRDRVYVFNRGEHPVIVYDREGKFLGSWGEGVFTNAHGATVGSDDSVYLTDNYDHTVRKFTPEGKLLLTIGTKDTPSDTGYSEESPTVKRGAGPFNRQTNVAIAPNGDIYVADGYRNARVHRFGASGKLLASWGEPGSGPGQFNLPHGIAVDRQSRVYVADRENLRIQVFTAEGKYLTEWGDVNRPCSLFVDRQDNLFVAELGLHNIKATGGRSPVARVSVFGLDGTLKTRWGGPEGCSAGNFFAPHGIWADSRGDVYVTEVVMSVGGRRGLIPPTCHTIQKFARK